MIWSNKVESMDLISTAAVIDPTSINKQFFDGEARRHPLAAQATLESWAQHSHDALLRAEHERMASNQLLTATANLVNDVSKDITEQKDAVNVAFAHNVEAKEAEKADYMRQLKENVEQISKTEQAIKDLEHAIADKSKYIQTVQTRLHLYNQRPCVENVRDNAQQAMLDELQQLEAAVDQMRDQVNAMQNTLRLLQDNQVMFEKQIQMKLNSIQVDRDHCQRHRAIFPDAIRLQGH